MKTKDLILESLGRDDMTVTQVADDIGDLARSTIGDAIERLHKGGHIHIVGWTTDKKAPIYRAGPGVNKKRPANLTPAQRTARYRETHAAEIRLRRASKRAPRSDSPRGLHPVGMHFIQLLQK